MKKYTKMIQQRALEARLTRNRVKYYESEYELNQTALAVLNNSTNDLIDHLRGQLNYSGDLDPNVRVEIENELYAELERQEKADLRWLAQQWSELWASRPTCRFKENRFFYL